MRWGIETSFRDLKKTIGTVNLHSKKVETIELEILARMILFNFCSIITQHVVLKDHNRKHVYMINFAKAIKICHFFISVNSGIPPPYIEGQISMYIIPIRPSRVYACKHRFQAPVSFCYRFS